MPNNDPKWSGLGPMPSDSELELALSNVKHDNDHPESNEEVWIERSTENSASYAASEDEFFAELDKQIK
jgi:hypothetical protein